MKGTTLLKWLIPAPIGAGSICLTMKLTNQANTSLLGLEGLDLKGLPQIIEKELQPKKPPIPPPPPVPPSSGGGDEQKGKEQQDSSDPDSQKNDQQDSGSAVSQAVDKKLEDLLKESMGEISGKASLWLSSAGTFTTSYEVINRVQVLAMLLKQFQEKQKTPGEGGGSSGQGAGAGSAATGSSPGGVS